MGKTVDTQVVNPPWSQTSVQLRGILNDTLVNTQVVNPPQSLISVRLTGILNDTQISLLHILSN